MEELRNPKGRLMFRPAFGSSETVAAGINRALGKVRTTHLALGILPGMDPKRTGASIDRFVGEVVPQLG